MQEPRRSQREFWLVVAAGSSLMLMTGAGAYWIKSNAERAQPTLGMATGDSAPLPRAAHAFVAEDAIGELLVSLPPELALDVCANLTADLARTAMRPCDGLREITAIAPAASPVPLGSAMAAEPEDVATAPQLPAHPVSGPESAPSLEPAPVPAAVAQSEPRPDAAQVAAMPEPPPAMVLGAVAAAGAPIAAAQTTERPAHAENGVSVSVLVDEPSPTLAAPEETMAYWLFLSGVPERDSPHAAGLNEDTTAEDDAAAAEAKAAAEAAAKAKAAAEAAAKAKAAAEAAKAARAAINADKEPGKAARGKGKDKDQGAGGAGSSGGNSGGGNNN
jgi:hypothetical protein